MIEIKKINFPKDCVVISNDFYNYDPKDSFNVENSVRYLGEDLLQISFPMDDIIVDLGWYGDVFSNKGEFKIQIIQNEIWDIPVNEIHSKSLDEVTELLMNILNYFTRTQAELEPEI